MFNFLFPIAQACSLYATPNLIGADADLYVSKEYIYPLALLFFTTIILAALILDTIFRLKKNNKKSLGVRYTLLLMLNIVLLLTLWLFFKATESIEFYAKLYNEAGEFYKDFFPVQNTTQTTSGLIGFDDSCSGVGIEQKVEPTGIFKEVWKNKNILDALFAILIPLEFIVTILTPVYYFKKKKSQPSR